MYFGWSGTQGAYGRFKRETDLKLLLLFGLKLSCAFGDSCTLSKTMNFPKFSLRPISLLSAVSVFLKHWIYQLSCYDELAIVEKLKAYVSSVSPSTERIKELRAVFGLYDGQWSYSIGRNAWQREEKNELVE